MELEYRIMKELLDEQKKTNVLLAQLVEGIDHAKLHPKQPQPTSTRKPVANSNVKQRRSG
jgi:hypothetical protein